MGKLVDLAGQRFGKLVAISRVENDRHSKAQWRCQCDCGESSVVLSSNLQRGKTVSCGCVRVGMKFPNRKRPRRDLGPLGTPPRHGHAAGGAQSPEYAAWKAMNVRCAVPTHPNFPNYGARGITVCDRWRGSFDNFLADMGLRPSKTHSLDRIDNAGNYEPSNCRWATRREQNTNKRSNVHLTHNGETLTMVEWAGRSVVDEDTFFSRIRLKWSMERALTEPTHRCGMNVVKTLAEAA